MLNWIDNCKYSECRFSEAGYHYLIQVNFNPNNCKFYILIDKENTTSSFVQGVCLNSAQQDNYFETMELAKNWAENKYKSL